MPEYQITSRRSEVKKTQLTVVKTSTHIRSVCHRIVTSLIGCSINCLVKLTKNMADCNRIDESAVQQHEVSGAIMLFYFTASNRSLLLSLSPPPAGRRLQSSRGAPASTLPATPRRSPPGPASCSSGRVTPPSAPNRCPATPCAASTCCARRRPAPCTCTSPARDTSTSEAS